LLARKGVPIGTIAHDPVRDFVIGPGWWHSWSVRTAYSFVRDVFVHDDTAIDFGGPQPESIRVHQIPIGPYPVPPASSCRHKIRSDMGFEPSDRIFLSFGQIRDGKNIDRFIRILPQLPADVKLLIVGSSGGNSQRPLIYYQRLAIDTGVSERCVWDIRFVPDDELGNIFLAADFLLLTYSAKFRSASGVMSAAATVGLTLLASSGPSPLKTAVLEYGLGVFVEPDDDGEILAGALRLLSCTTISPDWERYSRDHSWQENARRVIQALS
jgi:glycosyltransferase involved in cell wall biosynthesis